jgi:hypothetical protein
MMQNETTIRWQSFFDPSRFFGSVLLGVVGGSAAGLISGVLARGAMRGVSLMIGQTPGFTAGGTFIILVWLALGLALRAGAEKG